jgi:hypothetical protein
LERIPTRHSNRSITLYASSCKPGSTPVISRLGLQDCCQ